jgi:hypothetical protein
MNHPRRCRCYCSYSPPPPAKKKIGRITFGPPLVIQHLVEGNYKSWRGLHSFSILLLSVCCVHIFSTCSSRLSHSFFESEKSSSTLMFGLEILRCECRVREVRTPASYSGDCFSNIDPETGCTDWGHGFPQTGGSVVPWDRLLLLLCSFQLTVFWSSELGYW